MIKQCVARLILDNYNYCKRQCVGVHFILFYFILMILMREGDSPEGASPKGLGWPLHREKKKNLIEMKAGNPSQTQKIGQY